MVVITSLARNIMESKRLPVDIIRRTSRECMTIESLVDCHTAFPILSLTFLSYLELYGDHHIKAFDEKWMNSKFIVAIFT